MSAFRFFGRPETVVREIPPDSATGHARPARRAEDLLAPPPDDRGPTDQPAPRDWSSPAGAHGWAGSTQAPPGRPGEAFSSSPQGWGDPAAGAWPDSTGRQGGADPVAAQYWAAPAAPQTWADQAAPQTWAGPPAPQTWTDPTAAHSWLDPTGPTAPRASPGPAAAQAWPHPATTPAWSDPPEAQDHLDPAAAAGRAPRATPNDPAPDEPAAPHPAEAAALGAAFAADYLSWDEDDPGRRAGVLGEYLAVRRPVQLGWSGQGRQRADFALPGLVRPDGDGRVLVDVRVRVTPYVRVPGGRPGPPDDPLDDGPAAPSSAPAPAARGWRGLPGRWVRVSVAVVVAGDRLAIDAEEETEEPWAVPDPELADDLPEESP